ncbi:MAG: chemotaxis protein CheW [Vicinamibacterales bacterium]
MAHASSAVVEKERSSTTTRQFATFFIHDLHLGVEVLKVQELIRFQEVTRVPLASSVVRGLINLRGQIVTAIDLRRQFGFPDRDGDREPMNVVLRTDDGAVSLLVDEIGDVVEVSDEQFERAGHGARPGARPHHGRLQAGPAAPAGARRQPGGIHRARRGRRGGGVAMLHLISTFVMGLIGAGFVSRRRRPELHVQLMTAAFVLDVLLVLYIEATRHAVETVAAATTPLIWFHATVSLLVLGGYAAQWQLGRRMRAGLVTSRRLHAFIGIAFVSLRSLNYVTSFLV